MRLPLSPERWSDAAMVVYDVPLEPMPAWAVGNDRAPEADERGESDEFDGIGPPAPEDGSSKATGSMRAAGLWWQVRMAFSSLGSRRPFDGSVGDDSISCGRQPRESVTGTG
jgi:hypothetical protein